MALLNFNINGGSAFSRPPSPSSRISCTNKGNVRTASAKFLVHKVNLLHYHHHQNLQRCEALHSAYLNGKIPPNGSATINVIPFQLPSLTRSDFPLDFKFGASTSALQTEGPASIGGRGPSTWDYMITQGQEFQRIKLPESKDVATLSYLKYKEDVQLLKNMGVDEYRFSISWSRILPNGSGVINQEGIDFYNNLIDELLANGIEPFVTLFHFDLPQALQDKYNGFLDTKIVEDFKNYSNICFENFGDRVKRWTTINGPDIFAQHGYIMGLSIANDPTTYPYIVAHNMILAHAAAANLYKQKYQATQGGEIGISVSVKWFKPQSNSIVDQEAANRAFSFLVGWFLEPLVYGEYPFIMRAIVADRLPRFTDIEKEMVKGSCDFIGINYYTSRCVKGLPISPTRALVSYIEDQHLKTEAHRDGVPIENPVKGNLSIYICPEGLRDALIHMKLHYKNPNIFITENGINEPRNDYLPLDKALNDEHRIVSILHHLKAVQEALREDVNVQGYFIWALLDCMEIGSGNTYTARSGLNFTDYSDDQLKRYPKKSAQWLSKFLMKKA